MKKVISFVSACLLIISCIGFNASAESVSDSTSIEAWEYFPSKYMEACDFISTYRNVPVPEALDYLYFYNDHTAWFLFIPDDLPLGEGVYLGNGQSSTVVTFSAETYQAYQDGFTSSSSLQYPMSVKGTSTSLLDLSNYVISDGQRMPYISSGNSSYFITSTVPVYDFSTKEKIYDPETGDLRPPIDVSFSPDLYDNMSGGTVTYPSKQGANGDVVSQQVYNYTCTVSLTDDFIDRVSGYNSSLANSYTYQFTAFIVPSEYASSDISTLSSNSIYTQATKGQLRYHDDDEFMYLDDDRKVQYGHTDEADGTNDYLGDYSWAADSDDTDPSNASANGFTNIYVIPRSSGSVSFDINMQWIDWSSFDHDSYCIVVFSHLICMNEFGGDSYPLYFKSGYSGLTRESVNSFPMTFNDEDENIQLYEYYTYVSDSFSWSDEDVPPYLPRTYTDNNGNTWNPNTNPLDFNNLPLSVATLSDHLNNRSKTPEEFEEYANNWSLGENFTSTNFTDFGDIFSTSGSYFEFLTSCLKILPSWFIAIFTAFFTLLLALALIKFILD